MSATTADLEKVPGKAEIVNGKIVYMGPTGFFPGKAGLRIAADLDTYEHYRGGGYALSDNVGFRVNLPNRQSFSPDAAWYTGQLPANPMKFLPEAPAFAVEVRSEGDYGPKAERDISDKIADYFAAGTLVVWDVDLQGNDIIKKFTPDKPNAPTIFRRGATADAEPAVPSWTFDVDVLFR